MILQYLHQALIGIPLLSFLILIHEAGHYFAARWAGVYVEAFSIGFGPRLVGLQVGETEYRICIIPFGGYVAMRGENAADAQAKPVERSFESVSIRRRAVIAAAGPVVNIVFAVLVVWVAAMVGVRESPKGALVVAAIQKDSPAAMAGFLPGDSILTLEGKPVDGERGFMEYVAINKGRPVHVERRRQGVTTPVEFVPLRFPEPRLDIGWSGILFGGRVVADQVVPGGAAAHAGIQAGDTLLWIDGIPLAYPEELVDRVGKSGGKPMRVTVARPGARLALDLTARWAESEKRWMVGIRPDAALPSSIHRYGAVEAFGYAMDQSWKSATAIFRFIGALFSGRLSPKNMSGPVGIMQMSAKAASLGWQQLVEFLALVSINLGIMNFLPLVVTDGGRLVDLAYQASTGRKPNRRAMEILSNAVIYFFLAFFVYVTFYDLLRAPLFAH